MILSDADIKSFQELWEQEFGTEISKEDACEKGIKLLNLVSAVYKPMTKEEYEFIQKHREDTLKLLKENITTI